MQKILVKLKPMYGISFIAYKTEILVTRVPDSRLHTNLPEKTNMPRVESIKDGLMEQFIPRSPHKHHDLTQFTVLNFTFQRFRWIRNLNGAGVNRAVAKTSILTSDSFLNKRPSTSLQLSSHSWHWLKRSALGLRVSLCLIITATRLY